MNPIIEYHKKILARREADVIAIMQLRADHPEHCAEFQDYADRYLIDSMGKEGITVTITEDEDNESNN